MESIQSSNTVVELENNENNENNENVIKPTPTFDEYKYDSVDCLDEDEPISNQKYYSYSVYRHENVEIHKIRGVYATEKQCTDHVNKLRKKDKYFDIFMGEVGKWNAMFPTEDDADSSKYQNKKLDKLMKGKRDMQRDLDTQKQVMRDANEAVGRHRESIDNSKKEHTQRVIDNIKKNAEDYDPNTSVQVGDSKPIPVSNKSISQASKQATRDRLRKVLEERQKERENTQFSNHLNNEIKIQEQNSSTISQTISQKNEVVKDLVSDKKSIMSKLEQLKKKQSESN